MPKKENKKIKYQKLKSVKFLKTKQTFVVATVFAWNAI